MWTIIGLAVAVLALGFIVREFSQRKTFEEVHPDRNIKCSDCNKGGESCPTCPFRDKTYIPESDFGPCAEYDEEGNINWSSGQDDVPRPPDGIITFSEGKASKAYIEAKDKDIQEALDMVSKLREYVENLSIDEIEPFKREALKHSLLKISSCLCKALL